MKCVYLDNNATTKVAPEVRDAMLPFFNDLWGNPSSPHSFGGQVKKYVEKAREQVAALINADPSEIFFTGCGSESDNWAIYGTVAASPEKKHIITTRVEHEAILAPCRYLENMGYELTELGVDGHGQLDIQEIKDALRSDTALTSIMWANNETGAIFPMDEIAQAVKSAGGTLHSDAVQAVGKIPVDMQKTPLDMLSISAHKLYAPKGVGALYIRKGTKLNPMIQGGHQENGKRAGTENVPYIVGMGRAAEMAAERMNEYSTRVAALRDRLQEGLLSSCPGTVVNGDTEHRLPNTLNVSFEFIEGESILGLLDNVGVAASSGSACTSGSLEPSHVLRAMGLPFTSVNGSIRFSLGLYNTDNDIDYVLAEMPKVVQRLREISPFVND